VGSSVTCRGIKRRKSPGMKRQRQENHEFQASLGYMERLCIQKKKKKRKERQTDNRQKGWQHQKGQKEDPGMQVPD
jgi:hypothetical protein